jgi:hypothetical protein
VLGPRKLGLLIVSALCGWRKIHQREFSIVAIARHDTLKGVTLRLGADQFININSYPRSTDKSPSADLMHSFDVVFDTTGTPSGFNLALQLTKKGAAPSPPQQQHCVPYIAF